jgi:hypothetical protein
VQRTDPRAFEITLRTAAVQYGIAWIALEEDDEKLLPGDAGKEKREMSSIFRPKVARHPNYHRPHLKSENGYSGFSDIPRAEHTRVPVPSRRNRCGCREEPIGLPS